MALNTLKIIQHNVLAWTFNRRNELSNIYRSLDPDIILINAHGLRNSERLKIFQYNIYQRNASNELHAGVAIAVKIGIKHQIIDDLEEDYLALKIETSLGPIIIATGYQPPRNPQLPMHTILRLFRQQLPVLFAGDLNARHHILNHGNNNPAGEVIDHMIRQGSTVHIGPLFKTFITPRACGNPDIVLSNDRLRHNIHLSPGPLTTSDHVPVIIKISTSPIQIPAVPKLNYKSANWENFTNDLLNFMPINLDQHPVQRIDEELGKWFKEIENAIKHNIPTTTYRTIPHAKLTNEVRLLQQANKNIQDKASQTGWTQQLRNTKKTLQNNLQRILKVHHDQLWEDILQQTERTYRDPEQFWRKIKKLMGTDTDKITYLLDPHGTKLITTETQANEFRRHLKNIFQITPEENLDFCNETQRLVEEYLNNTTHHTTYDMIDLTRLDEDDPLIKPITRDEVLAQIRSFKNKKAPGLSKIDKNMLLRLPLNMLDALTHILNAALASGYFPLKFKQALIKMILKKGKQAVHAVNYRPISLLETAGKTYEKILNNRLKRYLSLHGVNNPRQHSYQKNRGTISAIALTYQNIAATQQERHQCNVIFRDVSKAFDKVWHDGLKFKISNLNMPRPFTASLCNFLDQRTATVQVQAYCTEPFNLKSGVPQGSVLSPTLFNLFTGDLGELTYSTYTAYADDVTQVVTHHGKSKEFLKRKTERAINELNSFEKKWKIKTNNTKFQIIHVSKKSPLPIVINNTRIQYTNTANLLGLTLKSNGIHAHVKQKRIQASTTLKKLRRFKNLSPRIKLHLYKALVLPILDYPSIPLNTIKKSNWEKLQSVQNRALRWVNGDIPPYNRTVQDLHTQYGLTPLNQRNHRLASAMWEKIRMEFPEETQEIEQQEFENTHAWWPLAYLPQDAPEPDPVYGHIRPRHRPVNAGEDEDEV